MPRNLEMLRMHISMNRLENVTVVAAAVSDRVGTMRMAEGRTPSEFHADPVGRYALPSIALDSWLAESKSPPPTVIKMDVEGAEVAVFHGARDIIVNSRPLIYVALHGEQQRQGCREFLEAVKYRVQPLDKHSIAESDEWLAEPE
jgi:FkbM family methyltransferase